MAVFTTGLFAGLAAAGAVLSASELRAGCVFLLQAASPVNIKKSNIATIFLFIPPVFITKAKTLPEFYPGRKTTLKIKSYIGSKKLIAGFDN